MLLVFILFNNINAIEYFSYQRNMMRNMSLRFLISCNYKKYKLLFENLNFQFTQKYLQFQDNINLKLIEFNSNYYSLSDDDRFLIENIVNLIL